MYRVGELDQRIEIRRRVETPDDMGGNDVTWVTTYTLWAHVRQASGKEVARFDSNVNEETYIFVFRNGYDILDTDQIVWEGDEYNVRANKKPKGRALYYEVTAERGVAQ